MQRALLEKPADLPEYDVALSNLGRVSLTLYESFEYAASQVAEFREAQSPEQRLDECLSACLFRFHALRYLKEQNIDAREDDDFNLDRLSFLGISFHYAGYHIRVLKGPGGELPGCGPSDRKTRFFNQLPARYLAVDGKIVTPTANLIVTWSFEANYGLGQLWLALPATGGPLPKDVAVFWSEPIPYSAEGLQGVPPQPPSTPTDDLDGMVSRLDEVASEEEITGREDKTGTA